MIVLVQGDEFSEDDEDDLPSSSDGEMEDRRTGRGRLNRTIKDDDSEQLDASLDLDVSPSRTPPPRKPPVTPSSSPKHQNKVRDILSLFIEKIYIVPATIPFFQVPLR